MQPHPQLKTYHSGQAAALRTYGFQIWDAICAQSAFYRPFMAIQAARLVASALGLAPKTAILYTTAVLNNVLLDQDHNNPCLQKVGPRWCLREVEYE